MSPNRSTPTSGVIALAHGLPPFAQPFLLSALAGKHSLLGENLSPALRACLHRECRPGGSDGRREEGIGIPLRPPEREEENIFDVPAAVYLAEEVTTTFDVAWRLLDKGILPPWGAVLAARQTEGRGQFRRSWHSPAGNLHVTFRLPEETHLKGGAASVLTGYLLASTFRRLGFPLTLKWPNDLLIRNQDKAGGILLEEREGILLAGVGINLVHAPRAEDLRREAAVPAGILFDRNHKPFLPPLALWRSLVRAMIVEYRQAVAGRRLSEILADLDPLLAWKNSPVTVADGNNTRITGLYEGIGPEGDLLLRLGTGEIRSLHSGSLFRP